MPSDREKSLILYAIWMSALAVLLVLTAFAARKALLLIYVSGVLAIGFSPTVRWIERQKLLTAGARRVPRWLAILLLYLLIIGTLVAIGFAIFPPLAHQVKEFRSALPALVERAEQVLATYGIHITWQQALEQVPGVDDRNPLGSVVGAMTGVLGGLAGFLTILILTFYLLLEAGHLRDDMLRLFPARRRPMVSAASRDITIKVSAWLTGQLLLGGIIGGSTALALWLLGVPFFYVLALVSAVGELIPIVGPILSSIPAIAIASTISFQKALIVLVFFVIQQQIENHVLAPKIMERQVGVSAVTVVVALLIGIQLLGILGAILAVPTAAILSVVFTELTSTRDRAA